MPSQNGPSPATTTPIMVTGAQKQQTEFLPDVEANAWSAQLYLVSRGHLMGLPMLRWLYFLMVVAALLWVAFGLPGGWLVGVLLLGAAALLAVTVRLMQRRAFISFAARPAPVTMTVLMPPTQKRPLYVTGILSVEQKVRSFTALPGFYRSFATREHALLCRVRERRIWRIGAWPEEEIGLWYAFFKPQEIDAVQPGDVRIGRSTLPGIAVTYRPSAPIRPERRRTPMQTTLYLAFVTEADRAAVLADLLVEWQPTAVKE